MDFSQDLVRGSIMPIILSLLKERPMYGYEMVKLVNARSNGQLLWKEGTLYPALHRLETEGWVKAQWQPAPNADRQRNYYALTRTGRSDLRRRVNEWQSFTTAVNSVLKGV
jgi:DNA-binding PadR family transcriptional regulator